MTRSDRPTDPSDLLRRRDNESGETRPPPLDAVPWLMVSDAELRSLPLDPVDAFVLSLIDGQTSVQALLDVPGLPRGEVLRLLARLHALGVISMREGSTTRRGRR